MGNFGSTLARLHNSGCTLRTFFLILHNDQRDQKACKIYISCFCKKDLVEDEWVIKKRVGH